MTVRCHNCTAPIDDLYHARPEHFRGVTRWWCASPQECGERAVALRLGISVAEQRAHRQALEARLPQPVGVA